MLRWRIALGGLLLAAVLVGCGQAPLGSEIEAEIARSEVSTATTFDWDGIKGVDSERCQVPGHTDPRFPTYDAGDGWIHWVFATKGASTTATLQVFVGEVNQGSFDPGEPLTANVWHFYTPFFDGIEEGLANLAATITLDAPKGPGAGLVISDYCPGDPGRSLEVTKTAFTSFERDHDWSVTKGVRPDTFYLYTDGSGDGDAIYTVAVRYEGFEDTAFSVFGAITIKNVGTTGAKTVTTIHDVLLVRDDDGELGDGPAVTLDCRLGEATIAIDPDDGSTDVTLPQGETIHCRYAVPFDALPGVGSGRNEVTVEVAEESEPYLADADWAFDLDDPTIERNASVTVVDDSDRLGTRVLGRVSVPSLGQRFQYRDRFTWEAFGADECGSYTFDNTVTIFNDQRERIDDDSASVDVYVQCFVFAGETAWAADGDRPGSLRYTRRGNWATYVAYAGEAKTTTLFAGQTIDVGRVAFAAPEDGHVRITVALSAPWSFDEVAENLKVQDYTGAPSGNPEPGLFAHKVDCPSGQEQQRTCFVDVPQNAYYGVHVNVGRLIPDPGFGR